LDVPARWSPEAVPTVAGLDLRSHVAARSGAGFVLAGLTGAGNPTLLPRAFLRDLGLRANVTPQHDSVTLASGLAAYRYPGLRPRSQDQALTVYAAPTTAGVLTLVCAAAEPTCATAAGSLALTRGRALPLDPGPAFDRAVKRIGGALETQRAHAQRGLRSARDAAAQARAADALAAAYRRDRRQLAQASSHPAEGERRRALLTAIDHASAAVAQLSRAASKTSESAYRSASRRVQATERALPVPLRFAPLAVPALKLPPKPTAPAIPAPAQTPVATPPSHPAVAPTPQGRTHDPGVDG
jgi:hypothetical protein